MSNPSTAVVLGRVAGHLTTESSQAMNRECEQFLVLGSKAVIFCDWFDVTGYDSGARLESTKWLQERRELLLEFHILFRSKLVAMGVAVANVAVGGILHATADRPVFERELRKNTTRRM